ncbi:hypothetical protein N9D31_04135, partial [Oligoflexaceae bacterium]|nr:hypothetical protein [Oligoflexaceae bacterium]
DTQALEPKVRFDFNDASRILKSEVDELTYSESGYEASFASSISNPELLGEGSIGSGISMQSGVRFTIEKPFLGLPNDSFVSFYLKVNDTNERQVIYNERSSNYAATLFIENGQACFQLILHGNRQKICDSIRPGWGYFGMRIVKVPALKGGNDNRPELVYAAKDDDEARFQKRSEAILLTHAQQRDLVLASKTIFGAANSGFNGQIDRIERFEGYFFTESTTVLKNLSLLNNKLPRGFSPNLVAIEAGELYNNGTYSAGNAKLLKTENGEVFVDFASGHREELRLAQGAADSLGPQPISGYRSNLRYGGVQPDGSNSSSGTSRNFKMNDPLNRNDAGRIYIFAGPSYYEPDVLIRFKSLNDNVSVDPNTGNFVALKKGPVRIEATIPHNNQKFLVTGYTDEVCYRSSDAGIAIERPIDGACSMIGPQVTHGHISCRDYCPTRRMKFSAKNTDMLASQNVCYKYLNGLSNNRFERPVEKVFKKGSFCGTWVTNAVEGHMQLYCPYQTDPNHSCRDTVHFRKRYKERLYKNCLCEF